jgi:FAD/FMN-containing dehydrogenase
MSKIAQYLQEHLLGEVTASVDARKHFSTDNSIFTVSPLVVVYPRNEHDVRKTARFAWQLAERGRILPITARGSGTDYTGAALGAGIVIAFPAHMNHIVQLDTKIGNAVVEPGIIYGRLQQTLHTHDRFIPSYPASLEYSTIGGAVSNNASGEKSYKYGSTEDYVKALRVVLANGEVIATSRLTKRELNKKLGLTTFEGEIYRQLDRLIEENKQTIASLKRNVTRNTAGYNITDVKLANGSFDLTPLLVGSQGTLGIISEVTLMTEPFNPETTVMMAAFDSIETGCEAANELRKLSHQPSAIEMVDGHLLSFVERLNPNQLKDVTTQPVPAMILFVEFDDLTDRQRRKNVKKANAIFDKFAAEYRTATTHEDKIKLWKVRQASSSLLSHSESQLKAVPIIDDAVVPPSELANLIKGAYQLFAAAKLQVAIWGSAGDGAIHLHPFFDLSQLGDRQRAFKLYDDYYKLVLSLGGSTSGQHNDGRLRGPLLPEVYGPEAYVLFQKVKKIFDPLGILNPGVKIDVTMDQIKAELRTEYSLGHLHNHMPRS